MQNTTLADRPARRACPAHCHPSGDAALAFIQVTRRLRPYRLELAAIALAHPREYAAAAEVQAIHRRDFDDEEDLKLIADAALDVAGAAGGLPADRLTPWTVWIAKESLRAAGWWDVDGAAPGDWQRPASFGARWSDESLCNLAILGRHPPAPPFGSIPEPGHRVEAALAALRPRAVELEIARFHYGAAARSRQQADRLLLLAAGEGVSS